MPSDITWRVSTPDRFDKSFIEAGHALLGSLPEWRAPLKIELKKLLVASAPIFEHAEACYWVALRDGKIVGRISAQVDHLVQDSMGRGTGQFGFFDCIDDQEVADALFEKAEGWLKERGMTRALGPFNLSVNQEVGLLIEGFDTPNCMLMPHGHAYYRTLVEGAGYEKVKELYAYDFDTQGGIPKRLHKLIDWADNNPDVELKFFEKGKFGENIKVALNIFNDAWSDNWGFSPMTEREAEAFEKSLKTILQPELAAFAYYKGEPVAFMVVLPDINEMTRDMDGNLLPFNWAKLLYRLNKKEFPRLRVPLMGIYKDLQRTRIGGVLPMYLIEMIRRETHKFKNEKAELSWILEDNPGINNMLTSIGGHVYKRYGVFEKTL